MAYDHCSTSITCVIGGTLAFMFPMLHQLAINALVAYALANTHFSYIALEPLGVGVCLTAIGITSGIFNRPAAASSTEHKDRVLPLAQPSNA